MEYKDYYEILGVARTATPEEIRSAFRKKAREYHPDVAKDKVKGAEKFKEVNEAYEVLSDPAKRAKYDQMGREVPWFFINLLFGVLEWNKTLLKRWNSLDLFFGFLKWDEAVF